MVGDVRDGPVVNALDGVNCLVPLLDLHFAVSVFRANCEQVDAFLLCDFGNVRDERAVNLSKPDRSPRELKTINADAVSTVVRK